MDELDQYFADLPAERAERLLVLHQHILQSYPGITVDMSYRMPTYKLAGAWVALANQKHYVSLYTCQPAHIAAFKALYPQIKTGKGCINLKTADQPETKDLYAVIAHALGDDKAHA